MLGYSTTRVLGYSAMPNLLPKKAPLSRSRLHVAQWPSEKRRTGYRRPDECTRKRKRENASCHLLQEAQW